MQNIILSNPLISAILGTIIFIIIIAMIIIGFKKRKINKEINYLSINKITQIDDYLTNLKGLKKRLNIILIILGIVLGILVIILFSFEIQYISSLTNN